MPAALAAAVDFRQVLEEQTRALQQRRQRTVMVGGKGIDARFNIGEITLEELGDAATSRLLSGTGASVWARGRARSSFSCCASLASRLMARP